MRFSGASTNPPRRRNRHSGQALAELAVIVPVMLLMVIGIADLGRLYGSAVAIEAAAREAADFGAFDSSYWMPVNVPTTVNDMRTRACTAAAGSHLQGYETTDPVNNSTCTNPTFACFLERNGASTDCEASLGVTDGVDCFDGVGTEPPCTVHVHMDYEFRLILSFPLLPGSIQISRDSRFRISNLTPPPP
jgi:hypothetical protein